MTRAACALSENILVAGPLLVVMGVCGSGKSTVGRCLAQRLGVDFLEGDELHSPGNVAQMASGVPLSDADRYEWLLALASALHQAARSGHGLVLSCSALKRSYRDVLRSACDAGATVGAVRFVYLRGDHALFSARMALRTEHYMPASLLESQFAILEPPGTDELASTLDASLPVEEITQTVLAGLGPGASPTGPATHYERPFPA
jgi:gluconokinase